MAGVLGVAVLGATTVLLLRQWGNTAAASFTGVGALILLLASLFLRFSAFWDGISGLFPSELLEYVPFLGKVLAVAWLAQITADLCREMGSATLAGYVELFGRVEILILSLPILEEVLEWASEHLSF